MGLIVKKKSGRTGLLGIWTLSAEDEMNPLLANDPWLRERLGPISLPQRRLQIIGTHLLIRELREGGSFRLNYDAYGRPGFEKAGPFISVSHTSKWVAVLMDEKAGCGIDIEIIGERIEKIHTKFMSDSERRNLSGTNRTEELYVHWCAKEALYKLHGEKNLHFSTDLLLEPFRYDGKGMLSGKIRVRNNWVYHRLWYERMDDHMLVHIMNE